MLRRASIFCLLTFGCGGSPEDADEDVMLNPGCDLSWCNLNFECPVKWQQNGQCDCGCQFDDPECGEEVDQSCDPNSLLEGLHVSGERTDQYLDILIATLNFEAESVARDYAQRATDQFLQMPDYAPHVGKINVWFSDIDVSWTAAPAPELDACAYLPFTEKDWQEITEVREDYGIDVLAMLVYVHTKADSASSSGCTSFGSGVLAFLSGEGKEHAMGVVLGHELGHTVMYLTDEYEFLGDECRYLEAPNVWNSELGWPADGGWPEKTIAPGDVPWSDLLTTHTLPTPEGVDEITCERVDADNNCLNDPGWVSDLEFRVGAFPGGDATCQDSSSVVRPQAKCAMRYPYTQPHFCVVCLRELNRYFESF